jgi:hypothetical protein
VPQLLILSLFSCFGLTIESIKEFGGALVIGKRRRSYLFPPQIGRVKRLLSQLLNHHGGFSIRKIMIDLRRF